MANTLDFNNVKKAMDALANSPEKLNALDHRLQEFRQEIGVPLNDVEFRYVAERLIASRTPSTSSVAASPASGLRRLPGGWNIRTEPA